MQQTAEMYSERILILAEKLKDHSYESTGG